MEEKKDGRGGYRVGAGRKKKIVRTINFGATQEVLDILSKAKNRSQFICDAIMEKGSN